MTCVCLANIDYQRHTSTEGNELQEGLRYAGWTLAGPGYDGLTHVDEILDRYRPAIIFVQDVRDWHHTSPGAFRKNIGFDRLELIGASGVPAFTVLKDAWHAWSLQSWCAAAIHAKGIATYYRHDMVRDVAPWTPDYTLLRMHHSVDAALIRPLLDARLPRREAVVTGNRAPCYPIRDFAFRHAGELGLDTIRHPGYSNNGADTPAYLARLCGYKAHVATASQWGCAYRKIIESVACGVTPITNLPSSDALPEIDGALVRIPDTIDRYRLKRAIRDAVAAWNLDERMHYAERAHAYYDWRESGMRLSGLLEGASA